MTATDTVVRVLRWAATAPTGPPPDGFPTDADALAEPPPAVRAAVGELAAVTAARLRLPAPPLGDPAPLGAGVVLLALAVGVRNLPAMGVRFRGRAFGHPAELFADLAVDEAAGPSFGRPAEWVARHGLVGPAAAYLAPELADVAQWASPLTGVLACPPTGGESNALAAADRILSVPHGRRLVARALAEPGAPTAVLDWRAAWLDRWRVREDRRAFVLDVYEAALTGHRAAVFAEAAAARAVLLRPTEDDARLLHALAVAKWWKPLALIARSFPEEVRARRAFGYDYLHGVRLYRLANRQSLGQV